MTAEPTLRDLGIEVYRQADADGGQFWRNAIPEERAAIVAGRIIAVAGYIESVGRAGYTGPDAIARYLEDGAAVDDALKTNGGKPDGLRFYTPRELAAMTTPEPDWIVQPGLLAVGAITEIDGKIKAAGKTTLILWMVRSILDGADFLGLPTRKAKVVYVTEQSRETFTDALRLAGLEARGSELRILFRQDIGGRPWPEVVKAAAIDGYEVVVFDTIGKLAGIREENSAGEWAAAMAPVQDLAASGRAVIVGRHDRKGGGEVGDSGRGSSQASGDVDIILALRRPEGHQGGNRRVLEGLSRYRQTPEKIVVELTDAGYVFLGSADAVEDARAEEFVSFALGSELRTNGIGPDLATLVELGGKADPPIRRTKIALTVTRLYGAGRIARSGEGKKGDPYRYSPSEEGVDADSFRTQTYSERTHSASSAQEDSAASVWSIDAP